MEIRNKIVVLTDWFIPAYKAGGPIQSCANFAFAMCKKYDVYVITGDTDLGETKPYISESNKWTNTYDPHIHVYYFSKEKLSYSSLKNIITGVGPDFIYLNHMFSPFYVLMPLWMWWKGQLKSKLILCPRGALFESALHYKRTFLKKIVVLKLLRYLNIYKHIRFHATNEAEAKAIQQFYPTDSVTIINNLANSRQHPFQSVVKARSILRIVFIARVVPIKNLLYALEVLQSVKTQVTFTIVGPIEDENYWNECQEKIKVLPMNIVVDFRGPKSNDDLRSILQENHLYILPTMGENFGHSIVEALLAGRPVLISDKTPWRNLTDQKTGWDISLSEQNRFLKAIEEAASWDQKEFDEWAGMAWNFAATFIVQSAEVKKYEALFS